MITTLTGISQTKWEENVLTIFASYKSTNMSNASYSGMNIVAITYGSSSIYHMNFLT